jgi:p-aminobenzoyl-glutamate transporter AbgT
MLGCCFAEGSGYYRCQLSCFATNVAPFILSYTAGIISLLTHIVMSVALDVVVHPKLTCEHQSPYQELHTQLCNPGCSDSC